MVMDNGSSRLTYELLTTLMAEVTGILKTCPISAIPSDTDEPQPLTPNTLLTMMARPLASHPGNFTLLVLYGLRRWRRTQYLADQFWIQLRTEFLQAFFKKDQNGTRSIQSQLKAVLFSFRTTKFTETAGHLGECLRQSSAKVDV